MSPTTARCIRCGIDRQVRQDRGDTSLCGGCKDVEADLAASGCGTERGYWRHIKWTHRGISQEPPCRPCLDAHAAAELNRSRARGRQPRGIPPCGTDGGYRRHRRNDEAACDDCLAAHNAKQRQYQAERREQAA